MNNMENKTTMEAIDAAKLLGCSYPHLINLIHKKKLKAQKVGKCWFVDSQDVYRAKQTNLVSPRGPRVKSNATPLGTDEIEVRITLPRSKYHLVNLALEDKENLNLSQFLQGKVDELHDKIKETFKGVAF